MLLSLESAGSLSAKERKLLDLAKMGYTLEEAQIAMDRCGNVTNRFHYGLCSMI